MTQEQKDLLLKDLCARLPYGIKAEIKYFDGAWELLAIYTNGTTYATRDVGYPIETFFEDCKPYLLPLSSMTDEQKQELYNLVEESAFQILHSEDDNPHPHIAMDWYNKHHFDYRGLIPMGLAIDATGKNVY